MGAHTEAAFIRPQVNNTDLFPLMWHSWIAVSMTVCTKLLKWVVYSTYLPPKFPHHPNSRKPSFNSDECDVFCTLQSCASISVWTTWKSVTANIHFPSFSVFYLRTPLHPHARKCWPDLPIKSQTILHLWWLAALLISWELRGSSWQPCGTMCSWGLLGTTPPHLGP